MSELHQRQQQLLDYIMGKPSDIQEHIQDRGKVSVDIQLHIYRNAYQVSFWETLNTDHEILGKYLGDDMFNAMVRDYIAEYPSTFRSLRDFGDRLPTFLTENKAFSQHPQIAELARFERDLLIAFDAMDANMCSREDLTRIAPEQWAELTIEFHPSVRAFITGYNVVDIWQHLKADRSPPDALARNEYWILWRNRDRLTEFASLDGFEQAMYETFSKGYTLEQAAEFLIEISHSDPTEKLLTTLFTWLDKGWITKLKAGLNAVD
ncbi:HvfC/BufC N-terminal domain-containing protein [Aliamphritea ceti]|uniref:HvfC/BufC N-terminal domain-containing protein n=1 Tax=Aliamphritea ceti TaxID=1524258 RepID=UPI0021C41735|nr:DNA-binding domain-containing protein [Aliamphritea ceti]